MILNSPFISGSLTVTGNTIISGSITAPQGIAGTASYASNAELLDGLDSTSFTTTSSFNAASSSFSTRVTNTEATASQYVAASASFDSRIVANDATDTTQNSRIAANEAKTGSYATTGSNSFYGNQSIIGSNTGIVFNPGSGGASIKQLSDNNIQTYIVDRQVTLVKQSGLEVTGSLLVSGDMTATGTITAQTLVVQTVTSSVDFVTGSTRFGSTTGNTHQFTGSVLVSGSQTINGALSGTSATLTSGLTVQQSSDTYGLTLLQSNVTNAGWGQWADTSGNYKLSRYGGGSFSSPSLTITLAGAATFASSVTTGDIITANTAIGIRINGSSEATLALNNTGGGNEWRFNSYTNSNLYFQSAGGATNAVIFSPAGFITSTGLTSSGVVNSTTAVCSNYIKAYCDTSDTRYIQLYMGNPSTYNTAPAGTVCKIVSGIEFNWYSDNWKIGATRSGDASIDSFVIGRNNVTNMAINSSGKVTIATSCAAFGRNLTVQGDVVAYYSDSENITMGISAGAGNRQSWGIQVCDTGDGDSTLHLNVRGGYVGINKGAGNTADYPLDVTGTIRGTGVGCFNTVCTPTLIADSIRLTNIISQSPSGLSAASAGTNQNIFSIGNERGVWLVTVSGDGSTNSYFTHSTIVYSAAYNKSLFDLGQANHFGNSTTYFSLSTTSGASANLQFCSNQAIYGGTVYVLKLGA